MVSVPYGKRDRERFVPEEHSSTRGDFQRDRGRLIHSLALRRLAQKTQVLSPTGGTDFARNRLTHSLEVAQVGREIGGAVGLDPDVVDTACLAHDLGHPPFGHNGESALDAWAADIGGFEGNAQTFRVLTRLESKRFALNGRSLGLNLTRASLAAATKYPWPRPADGDSSSGRVKFGYYDDDADVFDWMHDGDSSHHPTVEAQVMDLSDDIAYSVHDFEDAIVGGFVQPDDLVTARDRFLEHTVSWAGGAMTASDADEALTRLQQLDTWPTGGGRSRADLAGLKNFTSTAIGRFAQAVTLTARDDSSSSSRHAWNVSVPTWVRTEIELLKGIVAASVMSHEKRAPLYLQQRQLLTELLDALWALNGQSLEPMFSADWEAASSTDAKRRVIVDQVASLTDDTAVLWHERLV